MKTRIRSILKDKPTGTAVTIAGWIRTRRDTGEFSFIEVNDGSCLANIQVIADKALENYESEVRQLTTGCSVTVRGELKESPAKGQDVEIHAAEVTVIGQADPAAYPLQKKRHSLEFLREISHLRPRTNALGAVARVRSRLSWGVHKFFQEKGFFQVHTPVITTSDCEGAGEMFQVVSSGEKGEGDHFFGRSAGLTVSGQLQAEVYALSLGDVYTFGPTFRFAEMMLKYLLNDVMGSCADDLSLFDKFIEKGLLDKLRRITDKKFAHATYTEAVNILLKSDRKFEFPISWGSDLQSEHERYLAEDVFNSPLIVTDYPATIKPFYMRLNDDRKTVAAMDILLPGIGEIVGGSQREERYQVLRERMIEAQIDLDAYDWYLDLRRYGTVPHSGFGLGFERLVQFVTGMKNIREVIPFPRTPGSAPC